ncbi:prolyl oligopeptidase family serine peptidase, partial [Myxococcota bacterium]|nr:prolyl oligopeptidase family serine peptidase [Myxococcota bacterium]
AVLDDVIDSVRALVKSGIADPGRVGIYGSGFGGYLALEALVKEPELFAAGASFGAVTGLRGQRRYDRRFSGRAAINEKVLLPRPGASGREKAASPVQGVARIRAPILIAHGSQNPDYHEMQASSMESARSRADKDFESIRYEGATQEFLDDRDRIEFHRRLVAFFGRHLTGRPAGARDPEHPDTERQAGP